MSNFIICKATELEDGVKFKIRNPITNNIIEKILSNSHNYFYIKEEDYDNLMHNQEKYYVDLRKQILGSVDISSTGEVIDEYKKIRYFRVNLKNNRWRKNVRELLEEADIETFESDLMLNKRFFINNQNVNLGQDKMRFLWYDIETYDLEPFRKDDVGKLIIEYPILSIAVKEKSGIVKYWRNKGIDGDEFKEFREKVKSLVENRNITLFNEIKKNKEMMDALIVGEKVLIQEFLNFIKDYDIISAYNGVRFDDLYINERCKFHKISSFDRYNIVSMDYYEVYKKNRMGGSLKSYKLQDISMFEFESELNKPDTRFKNLTEVTKIDWRNITKARYIYELFIVYPDVLEEYNIQDCNLLDLLEEKLNFLNIHYVVARLSHCLVSDTIYNSRVADYLLLNEYHNRNMIAPSKPNDIETSRRNFSEKQIGGGYTRATRGYFKNIRSFDLKSSYPCHSITYNISPETYLRWESPDLSSVFNEKEIEYITYCEKTAKQYLSKGKVKKKKYDEDIDKKRKEMGVKSMEELSFFFAENYHNKKLEDDCKEKGNVFTPADINYDTHGWTIHPHRIFRGDREGALPMIYRTLLEERDKSKIELKKLEKGSSEWQSVYYYNQALKIVANAIFGSLALRVFRFYNYHLADAITTCGRWTLKNSILFERKLGHDVVLSDSVSSNSMIRTNIGTKKIEELFFQCDKKIGEKEFFYPKNLQTLTLDENKKVIFKKIKYIMRHKCKKKMYRIYTNNQEYVDVTEDHSLMAYVNTRERKKLKCSDIEPFKPLEMGDKINGLLRLAKNIIPRKIQEKKFSKEKTELIGYFIGNGCIVHLHKKLLKDVVGISFGNDIEELKPFIEKLKINNEIKSIWYGKDKKRKGDSKFNGKFKDEIIDCCYDKKNKRKKIPEFLFNQSEDSIADFIRGYFSADGTVMIRKGRPIIRLTSVRKDNLIIVKEFLLILGISSAIFKKNTYNGVIGQYSYHLVVNNIKLFKEKIGFLQKRKNDLLKNYKISFVV